MFEFLKEKSDNWKEKLLYVVIVLLVMVIFGLVYAILTFESTVIVTQKEITLPTENVPEMESYPEAKVVEKPEELKQVEESLEIVRQIRENSDGSYTVTARLKNVDLLGDGVVLNDFVEDIRFDEHVELSDVAVTPKIGTLFPLGEQISVSNYGPGPVDEKSTRVNIVLLDVNIDKNAEFTDLYEFRFNADKALTQLHFARPEFRSGKFILTAQNELVSL
ncbi:hypothetical protein GF354_02405 [Candidatus Peregrinibacteria bacterium]|nr:hypothetical protein [Candidatus Peregrinibacteria bacterium]